MYIETLVTKENIIEAMKTAFLRRTSIKKNRLTMDLNLEKELEENVFKLGHVLLDLHEIFNLGKPKYEPLTEFEVFKTPQNILDYIHNKAN